MTLTMNYQNVDRELVDALPMLLVPHARCIAQDFDGEHPGQYNFFEPVFRTCLDILLALLVGPIRDDLLRRSFAFVERMLASPDPEVPNLAKIAVFEGQSSWWFARAATFIGPMARTFLDAYEEQWRAASGTIAAADPELDVIDIFGVREVLQRALAGEVATLPELPGISAPREWHEINPLYVARRIPDAVVFLSCFGTSDPLVVAPVGDVACDPVVLLQLARDLGGYDPNEPDGREAARATCYVIPVGERVWRLRGNNWEHARYDGTMWIAPQFVAAGLAGTICDVLGGRQARLLP